MGLPEILSFCVYFCVCVCLCVRHSAGNLQFRQSSMVSSSGVEQLVKDSRRWLEKHGTDVNAYPSGAPSRPPAGPTSTRKQKQMLGC